MRFAKRREHRYSTASRDGRELSDEPALPDTRRRDHSDDTARAGGRSVQHAGERGQFPLAANQSRVPAADRPLFGYAQQATSGHREIGAFDVHGLRLVEHYCLRNEPGGGFAEHHPAGLCGRFHRLRQPDLLTHSRVTRRARADLACDHLARIQAHPKLQIDTVAVFDLDGPP